MFDLLASDAERYQRSLTHREYHTNDQSANTQHSLGDHDRRGSDRGAAFHRLIETSFSCHPTIDSVQNLQMRRASRVVDTETKGSLSRSSLAEAAASSEYVTVPPAFEVASSMAASQRNHIVAHSRFLFDEHCEDVERLRRRDANERRRDANENMSTAPPHSMTWLQHSAAPMTIAAKEAMTKQRLMNEEQQHVDNAGGVELSSVNGNHTPSPACEMIPLSQLARKEGHSFSSVRQLAALRPVLEVEEDSDFISGSCQVPPAMVFNENPSRMKVLSGMWDSGLAMLRNDVTAQDMYGTHVTVHEEIFHKVVGGPSVSGAEQKHMPPVGVRESKTPLKPTTNSDDSTIQRTAERESQTVATAGRMEVPPRLQWLNDARWWVGAPPESSSVVLSSREPSDIETFVSNPQMNREVTPQGNEEKEEDERLLSPPTRMLKSVNTSSNQEHSLMSSYSPTTQWSPFMRRSSQSRQRIF